MMIFLLIFLIFIPSGARAILPVLSGQGPVPLCSPDSIGLLLANPAPHSPTLLFASHHPELPPCAQPFPRAAPLLRLEVPLRFLPCGVSSRRLSHPRVGLEHALRTVLHFNGNHTGAAGQSLERRVFDVRCQYFPDRNQSVGRVLELSVHQSSYVVHDAPLDALRARHPGGAMQQPECKYSIHTNAVEGPGANSSGRVQLGDRVVHRWRCGDEYALKVYRCFVHDGRGRRHPIINDRGCSTDLSLMPHPVYSANASSAFAASRVFRFASSTRVFFDCLLYACLRTDPECRRMTALSCDNGNNGTVAPRKRRRRRRGTVTRPASKEFIFSSTDAEEGMKRTLQAEEFTSASSPLLPLPSSVFRQGVSASVSVDAALAEHQKALGRALWESQRLVKALALLNVASLAAAALLGTAFCRRRRRTFSIAQR